MSENKPQQSNSEPKFNSSWGSMFASRGADFLQRTQGLSDQVFAKIFQYAIESTSNIPQIQNRRIKSISSLPADYTKEQIGDFLRNAYNSEKPLRETSETLKWTTYPYFKIIKTYADIPTYKYYFAPKYVEEFNDGFMREANLVDKFLKEFRPDKLGHEATGNALTMGKVFYTYRYELDKSHNKVNYAYWQQLPSDFIWVVGKNNISGWTISFDMMYFLQEGTDFRQFGDLFEDYVNDFDDMFKKPNKQKVVYSSVDCKGSKLKYYPDNIKSNARGNPITFEQNGRWLYYVTLPVEKVFGFEIDDTTANVASPLAGLMLTYAQQGNYEEAQLSLILNPLIKIFTGEIPYIDNNVSTKEDSYKLSVEGRKFFEILFNEMMSANNTSGASFFTAPVENIKSHDYKEAVNANEISESFNRYGMEKAGLAGLLPVQSDVKASQVDVSSKIEARFATATIYPQIERLINIILDSMNLSYCWEFKMIGTIFTEDDIRTNAISQLDKGDTSQHFILCALDGISWVDRLSMMKTIKNSGILDLLQPPATSYTMSSGGRPPTDDLTDEKEKGIDNET